MRANWTSRTDRSEPTARRQGFTLIELIVVISIIAVLAALLVPAVMRVLAVGDRAKVRAELTGLQMAASNFSGNVSGGAGHPLVSITPSTTYKEGKFRLATSYIDPATNEPLAELVEYVDPVDGLTKTKKRNWPEIDYLKQVFPHMDLRDNGLRVKMVFSGQTDAVYAAQYDDGKAGSGQKVWPGNSPPAGWLPLYKMDANQALLFWLTGGTPTEFKGFATHPTKPLTPVRPPQAGEEPEKRKGPFMEVNAKKFTNPKSGVLDGRFRDPWDTPYAVFGALKNGHGDYHPQVSYADFEDPTNVAVAYFATSGYYNKSGVQIVSAGPNKRFGPGGKYTAGIGEWAHGQAGGDDLANFKVTPLSAAE